VLVPADTFGFCAFHTVIGCGESGFPVPSVTGGTVPQIRAWNVELRVRIPLLGVGI
jgi:hypothetical protein